MLWKGGLVPLDTGRLAFPIHPIQIWHQLSIRLKSVSTSAISKLQVRQELNTVPESLDRKYDFLSLLFLFETWFYHKDSKATF
jgi:hypothetical protein